MLQTATPFPTTLIPFRVTTIFHRSGSEESPWIIQRYQMLSEFSSWLANWYDDDLVDSVWSVQSGVKTPKSASDSGGNKKAPRLLFKRLPRPNVSGEYWRIGANDLMIPQSPKKAPSTNRSSIRNRDWILMFIPNKYIWTKRCSRSPLSHMIMMTNLTMCNLIFD